MKKKIFLFFKWVLALLAVACIWQYKLVGYGIGQLRGQLQIIRNAVPVTEAIANPATDTTIRRKLILAQAIRKYAMDSLGLATSRNYTTFYDQHHKPLLWVVTGAKHYRLQAKQWWFPVIGSVAYKGFFNQQDAESEAASIRREGFESDIYSPSAWSTLGFFTDPILSNQLQRGPGRLAELIIHELTHATVYLKSSVDFNENLATFVGEQGAIRFLVSTYGAAGPETIRYRNFLADQELYESAMNRGAMRLDSLYGQMPEGLPTADKALQKFRLIASVMSELNRLPFKEPSRFRFEFGRDTLPDNTTFLSFLRYRKNQHFFDSLLVNRYDGKLELLVADAHNLPVSDK